MAICTTRKRMNGQLNKLYSSNIQMYNYFLGAYPGAMTGETFGAASNAGQQWQIYWYQNSPNDGDEFSWSFALDAGTYNFNLACVTGTNAGKLDWYFDGVLVNSGMDLYSASNTYGVVKTFSYTVPASGWHTLKLKINGKNASSTNYYLLGTYVEVKV